MMGAQRAACPSDQIPASSGVIRPSGRTAVASVNVSPGPRVKMPPTVKRPDVMNYNMEYSERTYGARNAMGLSCHPSLNTGT